MTNEVLEKIRVLMESDVFSNEIKGIETAAELKKALADHGINISEDEVVQICKGIAAKKEDVLSEEDLDAVSGGGILMGAAIVAGGWAVCYGMGYVAGKIISNKSGVCR